MLKKIFLFPFIALLKIYKLVVSPIFPRCCRFEPSCSDYSKTAFLKYGFFKGSILTILRLLSCHPFGGWGYDPVPDEFKWSEVLHFKRNNKDKKEKL